MNAVVSGYQVYSVALGVEFKTRQAEVELRQLTFSLKLGEGKQGEVCLCIHVCVCMRACMCVHMVCGNITHLAIMYIQTWKGLWSGHTVAIKKLFMKQGGYSMLDNFHQEYMRLR